MDVYDEASPRLRQAHRLMFEVAQVCGDEYMADCLVEAMEANRDAQLRLTSIERRAREVIS
jgi:hypothetical protein